MFSASSRNRLTRRDVGRFPDDTLFHRVGRAVCHAGCLPRKELYETWEMARRVRRLFRGGRVIDLGAGHGLLAQMMLLLDDSSPAAVVIDKMLPPSSAKLHAALAQTWPRLTGRIAFVASALDEVEISRGRRRRLEPCVWGPHGSGSQPGRRGKRSRRRAAVLSRSQVERCARALRLAGRAHRYRRHARRQPDAARVPNLDAKHPYGHHAEKSIAARRAGDGDRRDVICSSTVPTLP